MVLYFQVIFSNIRWQMICQENNIDISRGQLLKILWQGLFFNQIFPSGVGGDFIRAYRLKTFTKKFNISLSLVIWDRFFGIFALSVLSLLGIPYFIKLGHYEIVLVSLIIFLFLSFLFVFLPVLSNLKFLEKYMSDILDQYSTIRSKKFFSQLIVFSIFIQLFSVMSIYLIFLSLGIQINFPALFLLVPLSILGMSLPISFAGWGVREGIMIFILGLLQIGQEQALLISIIFGLSLFFISIPGIIFLLNNANAK